MQRSRVEYSEVPKTRVELSKVERLFSTEYPATVGDAIYSYTAGLINLLT